MKNHSHQRTKVFLCTFGSSLLMLLLFLNTAFAAEEFQQQYMRGRLLYKKGLYMAALKEFKRASNTIKGRTHFETHYYLALSYFWLPDIQKAIRNLKIALSLSKTKRQKRAVAKLKLRITKLYGRCEIVPEVDPDDVGALKILLKPKIVFSNRHKKRYFKILSRRLKKKGLSLSSANIYLPRGDYIIKITNPQCLQYGLTKGQAQVKEITIGEQGTQITLRAKASCVCEGGQKIFKKDKGLYCACPSGTAWNTKKNRCEVVTPTKIWPWVLLGSGVVAVSATAVIVGLVLANRDGTDFRLIQAGKGGPGNNSAVLWSNK